MLRLKVLGFFSKFFTKCVGYNQAAELLEEKDLLITSLNRDIKSKDISINNLDNNVTDLIKKVNNLQDKLSSAEIELEVKTVRITNLEKEIEKYNSLEEESASEDISEISKLNEKIVNLEKLIETKRNLESKLIEENKVLTNKLKSSLDNSTVVDELKAENKMLKDKIASLTKTPTEFLDVDALLYSYVDTLSLDKIKETKDAIVAAVQTDNTLLRTINNALKDTDEKSSLKKMLRAVWSRRKKQLNPIYDEISNFGKVTK